MTCHVISSVKSCGPKTVRVKSNSIHSVRNAAQKCPVIIWVCIDDKKWSRKDVTCHVHYFYPKFFLWHLGSSCRNFGQTWQAPTAAQKHRVIYALRHWHRRKTLHNDLFLRISFGKYISILRHWKYVETFLNSLAPCSSIQRNEFSYISSFFSNF